jgi:hypothetical protein
MEITESYRAPAEGGVLLMLGPEVLPEDPAAEAVTGYSAATG